MSRALSDLLCACGAFRFGRSVVSCIQLNTTTTTITTPFPRLLGQLVQPDTEELAPAVRQQVDELPPIESLPPGQSTFWLEMGRNQLGLPIQVGARVVWIGADAAPTAERILNVLHGFPVSHSHRIQVPVIIFRGCHVGPVVGITAAIHGNELNGVPVLFSLLNSLDKRELYGAVVAVTITNPIGYQLNSRYFSGGVDLNRYLRVFFFFF